MNKITLLGNVGKSPVIKEFNGEKIAEFSIADNQGDKSTIWWNCVVWGKRAEVIEKYVTGGSQLYVEGKITQRPYTDKNGIERMWQEVRVTDFQLLGKKGEGSANADDLPE